jgi:hypothetical protein
MVEQAKNGNVAQLKMILDRTEGKVRQSTARGSVDV